MKKIFKELAMALSLLLAIVMCVTVIPSKVSASDYDDDEVVVRLKSSGSKKTITVDKGDEIYIVAKLNGEVQDEEDLKYKSNKRSVAKVSNDGVITAKKKGTAKITVKTDDGKKKATIVVKVGDKGTSDAKKVKGIWITNEPTTIKVGGTAQMKYTTKPKTKNLKVKWECSDTSIAEVDSNGKVTGIAPGETTVYVSVNGHEGACRITVVQ